MSSETIQSEIQNFNKSENSLIKKISNFISRVKQGLMSL